MFPDPSKRLLQRRGDRRGAGAAREELQFTLQNEFAELGRANELATALLDRCGAGERVVYAVQLALEEVLSNVVRHGYSDAAPHEIAVRLSSAEGVVELEVVDDGIEFDPTNAPAPALDVPLCERRAGGLGIHLLRTFVSEVRYERRGDRNVLHVWI